MSVTQTAKRRRRQAMNGYRHIKPMDRPRYKKADAGKSARREQRKKDTEQRMRQKKSK